MIPIFLIHGMSVLQTPTSSLSAAFDPPSSVVAGLPLVLPYRLTNASKDELSVDLGLNQASWVAFRIVDVRGTTVAASRPEVETPEPPDAPHNDVMVQVGPRIGQGQYTKGRLVPLLDTSRLAPGAYTLDVQVEVPLGLGGPARFGGRLQKVSQTLRYPFDVRSDPAAVRERCEALVANLHRVSRFRSGGREYARELFLADRAVVRPLILRDLDAWTRDDMEYVVKGLLPYATPEDARAMGLFADRWPGAFVEAAKILRRSPNPEVVQVADGFKSVNGAVSP